MRSKLLTLTVASLLFIQVNAQKKNYTNFADTTFIISEVIVETMHEKRNEVVKLPVPAKFLPMSTTTIPTVALEQRGITNLQDAVKFLPNTRMRTTYGAYQQFEVRGFDYTPIMIDGIRDERTSITNSAPLPDLSSVESIELLKGPASVLYGHSTVGGVVNIVRKAPTEERIFNALMSYGSWDNRRAMIDFGGKFIGPFNYRAIVNWSDNEGYRYTNDKRFSGYFALGGMLDEKQELDIRAGFNRDWYGTEIGLPRLMASDVYNTDGNLYLSRGEMLPGLNRRSRYNNQSDFMKNHASNVSVRYSNKISDAFKLENRIAYNYDNIDYFSTEELSYLESENPIYKHYYMKNGAKQYICLDTVQLTYPLRFAYSVHVLNEQLEASGKITFDNGMKYNYLGGYNFVMFMRDTYRGYSGNNPDTGEKYKLGDLVQGPGLYSKVPVYNPHSMGYMDPHFGFGTATRNYTHALYLQNLLEVSEQFKVMLAGRFDNFVFKTANQNLHITKKRETIKDPDYSETSSSAFTYRVGMVYLPTSDISVYGSFANFFMPYRDIVSPNVIYINENGNRFYPKDGDEAFKPQSGYQGELGVRYSINGKLQATASAFYIRKSNEKKTLKSEVVEDGEKKSVVGIVGASESKGFELELSYSPVREAMLSLGYGYTDATVRDISKNEYMETDLQKGMRLAGVPKNTFFAAGSYQISKGIFNNLGFNFTVTYTDNVYRSIDKGVVYPAYWLTDLGASYKLNNGIQLSLNVNNIFDEKYYNQSLGTQMVPSMPRNYLLTLSYSL